MYIKIPHCGNLELTAANFSRVYFRCPICHMEHYRDSDEYFAYLTEYGFDLEKPCMCLECCSNYMGHRVEIRMNNPGITESELDSMAMNLTKESAKENDNHVFCKV